MALQAAAMLGTTPVCRTLAACTVKHLTSLMLLCLCLEQTTLQTLFYVIRQLTENVLSPIGDLILSICNIQPILEFGIFFSGSVVMTQKSPVTNYIYLYIANQGYDVPIGDH